MTTPTTEFAATLRMADGLAVVEVVGEVDISTAPQLAACLRDAAEKGSSEVVLDATRLTFIDSTGIAALVDGMKQLPPGSLRVRRAPAQMRKVMEITGLTELIPLQDEMTSEPEETRIVVRLDCGHEILEVRGATGDQELAALREAGGRLPCGECGRDRTIAEFFAVEP